MDPDERRERFLERNRAAASRCRQKRKVWVNSLEKKADDLVNMNVSLSVSRPLPSPGLYPEFKRGSYSAWKSVKPFSIHN